MRRLCLLRLASRNGRLSDNSPAKAPGAENYSPTNLTADNNAEKNDTAAILIETSWLLERGLEHATIRHAGVGNVLYITLI